MSSPQRKTAPEDDDGQPGLFGRPERADAPVRHPGLTWNPAADLRRLIGELTRATGLTAAAVRAELAVRLGVRTLAAADLHVVREAVSAADRWLADTRTMPVGATVPPRTDRAARSYADRRVLSGVRVTEEQRAASEAFGSGGHMALQAGAGTGKTTTLLLLAAAAASAGRRGQYFAFNRPIADAAAMRFPRNVACRTAHSLAHAAVGRRFERRLQAPRKPAWQAGAALGIAPAMEVPIGDRTVTNRGLAYAMVRTVRAFCQSADPEPALHHVPWLRGLAGEEEYARLAEVVLPYAVRAWRDLQDPSGDAMRFEHDHYFKMWAMTEPRIAGDFLLLDEAQDTNPVLEQVFNAQRGHAQLVMVGDSAQAIYGWRGARDVMAGFAGLHLVLSQSFRFGPALARQANRWLTVVDSPVRLRGDPGLDTTIGPAASPDAVLCRTNVGAMLAVLDLLAGNRSVGLVGGGRALEDLAVAAGQLKAGGRAGHRDLVLFGTWQELREYAEDDPSGHDLLPLVEIIDEHGVDLVLRAVRRLDDERRADVVVSTAHKAKGREWDTVRIAPDFEPVPGEETDDHGRPVLRPVGPAEARLAYVAVTRARHHLDPSGLAWFDDHPDAPPAAPDGQPVGRA
ncbi:AAA domain-containing protein [Actinacidiphila alni]|uniref:AAA domain-containing protein n=1 Tax=Actinacidiphila alni TaxID=380248 RepID=A0A1I2LFJ2_9ACTN|nr:UvrD-helicase domain-containing protein [Actinacidiphila alni]SFF77250.1 AAA domain-containing protein [Actinacidiphila alni]